MMKEEKKRTEEGETINKERKIERGDMIERRE